MLNFTTLAKQNKKKITIASLLIGLAIMANPVFASYEISDGSVRALYHLEDTADSSGNGYNLTNTNSVSFTTGKFNNGASSGTGNTNKKLSVSSDLGITDAPISISLWVKLTEEVPTNANDSFFETCNTTHDICYYLWYRDNAGVKSLTFTRGKTGSGAQYSDNVISALGTTNWHNIIGSYDGTNIRLWLDGVALNVSSASGYGSVNNNDVSSIFYSNFYAYYGSAVIDEIVVFNNSISTSTRDSLYNSGTGNEVCVTAGCGAGPGPSSTSTLSTSTDCFLGTDSTDWELIKNLILWIFYLMFTLIIVSVLFLFLKKFNKFGR